MNVSMSLDLRKVMFENIIINLSNKSLFECFKNNLGNTASKRHHDYIFFVKIFQE